MKVIGANFTSSPSRRNPITALRRNLEDGTLTAGGLATVGFATHRSIKLGVRAMSVGQISFARE